MTKPACKNCSYWAEFSVSKDMWGECRRRAPEFSYPNELTGGWPRTEAGGWCGDGIFLKDENDGAPDSDG